MDSHLIIVPSDFTQNQQALLVDRYLSGLSKNEIVYRKPERRIIVKSLNMQFFFRKNSHQLIEFANGREFATVRVLNCNLEYNVMSVIYSRSKEMKFEKIVIN